MTGRLLVGTSGFAYRHWRGRFYPQALPARAWLEFYTARFATVELNNPFYRLPTGRAFAAWRDAAPEGFVFAVKASRYLTHIERLKNPRSRCAVFSPGRAIAARRSVPSSSSSRPASTPTWTVWIGFSPRSAGSA